MVRIINHDTRRRDVLQAVVERYIDTASCVSSEDIRKLFDCSSATVRNIMADLEEQGYLAHLHTSSGRVPTDKGYRYYVDLILKEIELVEDEKQKISNEYLSQLNELENILERASQVVSTFTHCAGIVSSVTLKDRIICKGASFITEYPELNDVAKVRGILKFLEQENDVLDIVNRNLTQKLSIYIGWESARREISDCSLVVSTFSFENKPSGRIGVLGPRSMDYSVVIPTIEYISDLLSQTLKEASL